MADEKKPIELTDDELDNAAGGLNIHTPVSTKGIDKRVNSAQDKLSEQSSKTIRGIGAETAGLGAGIKSGIGAGTLSDLSNK